MRLCRCSSCFFSETKTYPNNGLTMPLADKDEIIFPIIVNVVQCGPILLLIINDKFKSCLSHFLPIYLSRARALKGYSLDQADGSNGW